MMSLDPAFAIPLLTMYATRMAVANPTPRRAPSASDAYARISIAAKPSTVNQNSLVMNPGRASVLMKMPRPLPASAADQSLTATHPDGRLGALPQTLDIALAPVAPTGYCKRPGRVSANQVGSMAGEGAALRLTSSRIAR
jgi:hypothetical protein